MPKPTKDVLEKITEPAHIPAIGYAYVDANHTSDNTSITYGKKNAQPTKPVANNEVNDETRFPAASLSKIAFTYLVLRLAQEGHISLDEELHHELPFERLMEHGKYPDTTTQEYAEKLTIRHVLSHASGLPNVGSDPSKPLKFNSEPGTKYEYSGEAILYLQKFIEKKRNMDLQTLAQMYLFDQPPTGLGMTRSTFLPPSELDTDIVSVHSELGKPMSIEESLAPFKDDKSPATSAVGTLLTTAGDFSKFMSAWLMLMDDKDFKQAFEPPKDKKIPTFDEKDDTPPVCGLGWHLYKDDDGKLIAYQYGENTKMRAFVAINVTDKKGAVFFTNCEHGMSIANQIFSSPDLAPIGKTKKLFQSKSMSHHSQIDEPGWQETFEGVRAEDKAKDPEGIETARKYFEAAVVASPKDESKKLRLQWFNAVHPSEPEENEFTLKLETFVNVYENPFKERIEIGIKDDALIYKKFDQEIKLKRISENEFVPEKDQSFKLTINNNQVTIDFLSGDPKYVFEQSLPESRDIESFIAAVVKLKNNQVTLEPLESDSPYHLTSMSEDKTDIKSDEVELSKMSSLVKESETPPKPNPTKVMKTKLKVQAVDNLEKIQGIQFVSKVFNSDKMKDHEGNFPPEIKMVQERLASLELTDISNTAVVSAVHDVQSILERSTSPLNQFATEAKEIVLKSNSFYEMKTKMEDNHEFSSEVSHQIDLSSNIYH
ncbi:Uncharacterized protein conserved in bacteria [Legionella pneumophila]|uniref:serine hydrolase domain-containing protein n=1 Tax=Legionella pneumophila TaxID=446 RepID=UPI0007707473|nr:serine hydrolase domain-containing protein [Legionella pneumophila]CZG40361.1 Uncharacterized protein conserved in bacteria [Legionella pneumophila]CZH41181.1 Uncharacterized protein conserved in bacteria [Legionella pneumophila]